MRLLARLSRNENSAITMYPNEITSATAGRCGELTRMAIGSAASVARRATSTRVRGCGLAKMFAIRLASIMVRPASSHSARTKASTALVVGSATRRSTKASTTASKNEITRLRALIGFTWRASMTLRKVM